jgi:hypothetical protein
MLIFGFASVVGILNVIVEQACLRRELDDIRRRFDIALSDHVPFGSKQEEMEKRVANLETATRATREYLDYMFKRAPTVKENQSSVQNTVRRLPHDLQIHVDRAKEQKRAFLDSQITISKGNAAIAEKTAPSTTEVLIGSSTRMDTKDCSTQNLSHTSVQDPAQSPGSVPDEESDKDFDALLKKMCASSEDLAVDTMKAQTTQSDARTSSPKHIKSPSDSAVKPTSESASWDAFLARYHSTPKELAVMRKHAQVTLQEGYPLETIQEQHLRRPESSGRGWKPGNLAIRPL